MMSELLTVSKVALRLGYTGETIRRWISEGKLQAQRLPSGRIRIEPEAVEALLKPAVKD